ncbi:MAG: hypothetical protein CMM01_23470 [Rhodopirellula sp.]|nr:hypothetical protein [Rhodopirellula sp.]
MDHPMLSSRFPVFFATALFLCLPIMTAQAADKPPTLAKTELGATRNVHSFGKTMLCGQPTAAEFAEAKKRGIKTVITLREKNEIDWDEAAALEQLELNFYQLGFRAPDSLTPTLIEKTVKIMGDPKRTPVMLHCASANRVGALWLAHRVLNDKLDIATARKEAKIVGLRTPAYEERVLSYIKKKQVAK